MKGPKMAKENIHSEEGAVLRNESEIEAREFLRVGGRWADNPSILDFIKKDRKNLFEWFRDNAIHPVFGTRLIIEREWDRHILLDLANEIPEGVAYYLIKEAHERVTELSMECSPIWTHDEFLKENSNAEILGKLGKGRTGDCLTNNLLFRWRVDNPLKCLDEIIERAVNPRILFEMFRCENLRFHCKMARGKIKSLLADDHAPHPQLFINKLTNDQILDALNDPENIDSNSHYIDLCSWLMNQKIEPIDAIHLIILRADDHKVLTQLVSRWLGALSPVLRDEVVFDALERCQLLRLKRGKRNTGKECGVHTGQEVDVGPKVVTVPPSVPKGTCTRIVPAPIMNTKDPPKKDEPDEPVELVDLLKPGEFLGDVEDARAKKAKQKPKRKSSKK
jgi:hypothetical protein